VFELSVAIVIVVFALALVLIYRRDAIHSVEALSQILAQQRESEEGRLREMAKTCAELSEFALERYRKFEEQAFLIVRQLQENEQRVFQKLCDLRRLKPAGATPPVESNGPSKRRRPELPREPSFTANDDNVEGGA
jgi:hypothetical protein